MLYRPNSEQDTLAHNFVRDFAMRTGADVELISLDSQAGAHMAELYGAMQYPTILALRSDGELLHMWDGPRLPLIDEVASYLER